MKKGGWKVKKMSLLFNVNLSCRPLTFDCRDCSQRNQEYEYWKRRNGAKRVAMALLTLDDVDTFSESEGKTDKEACLACEYAE